MTDPIIIDIDPGIYRPDVRRVLDGTVYALEQARAQMQALAHERDALRAERDRMREELEQALADIETM